jgi:hypothetical protein
MSLTLELRRHAEDGEDDLGEVGDVVSLSRDRRSTAGVITTSPYVLNLRRNDYSFEEVPELVPHP